nr:homoserine O-succinyltransferase [Secundilactobacillus paracollinoides]
MTVILKNGFLKQQQATPLSDTGRLVKILVVNLMPNKLETERQFAELFSQLTVDVQVTFARMASHHSKHISEADFNHADYVALEDLQNSYFDGLVVTGAPVEELDFETVDYWSEFKALLDWRETHVREVFLSVGLPKLVCMLILGFKNTFYQVSYLVFIGVKLTQKLS